MRNLGFLVAGLLLLGVATPARAQWFENTKRHCEQSYAQNRDWPVPYIQADRETVYAPFTAMIANGWRRQNMVCNYHFDPDSSRLNAAGELQVRRILDSAPAAYRTIYLERNLSQDLTAARLDALQQAAVRFSYRGEPLPDVLVTNLPSHGRPAAAVDRINTQFDQSAPLPRLTGTSNSTTPAGN